MSQVLTLELNDELYAVLKQQADRAGMPLSQWIALSLEQRYDISTSPRTEAEKEAARQRFRRHAGSLNLGYATGADNESIDADLIRASKTSSHSTLPLVSH